MMKNILTFIFTLSLVTPAFSSRDSLKRSFECESGVETLKKHRSAADLDQSDVFHELVHTVEEFLSKSSGLHFKDSLDEDSLCLLCTKMESLSVERQALGVWMLKQKLPSIVLPNCRDYVPYKVVKMIAAVLDKDIEECDSFLTSVQNVYNMYCSQLTFDGKIYRSIFMAMSKMAAEERARFETSIKCGKKDFIMGLRKRKIPGHRLTQVYKQTLRRYIKALSTRVNDVEAFSRLYSDCPELALDALETCPDETIEKIRRYTEVATKFIDTKSFSSGAVDYQSLQTLRMMIEFHQDVSK